MPPRHSMRPYRVSLSRSAESRRVFCPCLAGDIKVKTNFAFKIGRPAITGSATYEPDRAPRSRGFAGCRGRTKPNCGTAARERTRSSGSNGTRREGSEVAPRSCRLQEPRRTAQPRYHGFATAPRTPISMVLCPSRQRDFGPQQPRLGLRIVLHPLLGVDHHCCAIGRVIGGPVRDRLVTGLAGAGKGGPGCRF